MLNKYSKNICLECHYSIYLQCHFTQNGSIVNYARIATEILFL